MGDIFNQRWFWQAQITSYRGAKTLMQSFTENVKSECMCVAGVAAAVITTRGS